MISWFWPSRQKRCLVNWSRATTITAGRNSPTLAPLHALEAGLALHAHARGQECLQPSRRDLLVAFLARAVGSLLDPAQRFFERDEVVGALAGVEERLLLLHRVAADVRHVVRVALVARLARVDPLDLLLDHAETLEH